MERRYYKAINFDLDTNKLSEIHPSGDYRRAYADLRDFFFRHKFNHRQGSGYVSQEKISSVEIYDLIGDLCEEFDWIADSVEMFDVTNVGNQYDLVEDIKSSVEKESTIIL